MRFLMILIEFVIPLGLTGFIFFVIYQYISFTSSKKQWSKQVIEKRDNRHNLSLFEIEEDWNKFLFFSNNKLPLSVEEDIQKITSYLSDLKDKAEKENWYTTEKKLPQDLYPFVDILYKHYPDMINEYKKIPVKIANEHKISNDKTATDFFIENSRILSQSAEKIINETFQDNLRKMATQQHYFKEKFKEAEM